MKIPQTAVAYATLLLICLGASVFIAGRIFSAQEIEIISKLTPALATLVVGSIACHIAWRQAKTAETQRDLAQEKLRLDLFSKRYEVISLVAEFYSDVMRDGEVVFVQRKKLAQAHSQAKYLFGDDVVDHLKDVLNKSMRVIVLNQRGQKMDHTNPKLTDVLNEHQDLLNALTYEIPKATEKLFQRYVRFPEPR